MSSRDYYKYKKYKSKYLNLLQMWRSGNEPDHAKEEEEGEGEGDRGGQTCLIHPEEVLHRVCPIYKRGSATVSLEPPRSLQDGPLPLGRVYHTHDHTYFCHKCGSVTITDAPNPDCNPNYCSYAEANIKLRCPMQREVSPLVEFKRDDETILVRIKSRLPNLPPSSKFIRIDKLPLVALLALISNLIMRINFVLSPEERPRPPRPPKKPKSGSIKRDVEISYTIKALPYLEEALSLLEENDPDHYYLLEDE